MMKIALGFALLGLCLACHRSAPPPASVAEHSYVPPAGFVPDSITAVRLAEAVWIPIYGEAQIRGEYPLVAHLEAGVWRITGSLPAKTPGGVAVAEIAKVDGRVLRVSHGR